MKRKKARKRGTIGCDCEVINKNFKRYVKKPQFDDSGFVLPDGDFVVLPAGKEGGKSEDDYTHDDLIGLFDDNCYVNDYIYECDGVRVRVRKNFWEDNVHYKDKYQMIVVAQSPPTREQIKTLVDFFDERRHGAIWLSQDNPGGWDCEVIKGTDMKPRKADFQHWYSKCWG